jgi:FkbM family methyltransferase
MNIDPNDLRTAPMSIISEGNYEEFESMLLLEIAKVSKLFCDIGANIGFYTMACGVTNPNLRIMSFEPNQIVVKNLIDNLQINFPEISRSNIQIFPIALGEYTSENVNFYVPKVSGSGAGSLKNLHPEEGDAFNFKTKVEFLDLILENEDFLDLIKMDVEGSELSVLKGSLESISKFKPTIFIELLRKWMKPFGNHPQDVVNLLAPMGYLCYAIGVDGLTEISLIDDETIENNFIFVHPQRTDHHQILIKEK